MITIFIIAILCYVALIFIVNDGIFKFDLLLLIFSFFIGFLITILLSYVLMISNVGEYEFVKFDSYESITISDDECNVIIYNFDDSGSYSIDHLCINLHLCSFVDDGSFIIELHRWHFYDADDWLFLLPIFESYVIHR